MTDIVVRLNASLSVGYSELRKEAAATITRLRAKIKQMEQQEPVAIVESWANGSYSRNYKLRWLRDVNEGAKLYDLPGAQGE